MDVPQDDLVMEDPNLPLLVLLRFLLLISHLNNYQRVCKLMLETPVINSFIYNLGKTENFKKELFDKVIGK